MDINSLVITDQGLNVIDNGAWVGDFKSAPGLRLKVRGLRSLSVSKALEKKKSDARIANDGEPLTEEQLSNIMLEVLAEQALLDWDGLTQDGKPLKYDAKMAYKWITSRNGDALANLVMVAAQRIDSKSEDFVEVAVKN